MIILKYMKITELAKIVDTQLQSVEQHVKWRDKYESPKDKCSTFFSVKLFLSWGNLGMVNLYCILKCCELLQILLAAGLFEFNLNRYD